MKKTRDEIQKEAVDKLKLNNYNGTICLSTGTGKSKVAIDSIREGNFKNILIASPRTNLKENWRKELNRWGFANTGDIDLFIEDNKKPIHIVIENIQTCYKWVGSEISNFDLIIIDEVHTAATGEYGKLIINARELNIPVIGLSATPDNKKFDKDIFYKKYIPILYEYYNSAEDGLINKRNYIVYQYFLNDDDKVIVGSKSKKWSVGEKTQYEYLSEQIKKGQKLMAATGSENWFEDAANWFWKGKGSKEQKNAAMIYLNSIKYRKEFLWNLTSSARITTEIANKLLLTKSNKILVFSERNEQVLKITPYVVYSKNTEGINTNMIKLFNDGETRLLGSCQSLTLGLNLKGANYGIMESYSGSNVSFLQKSGRTDRLKVEDNATIIFIVPMNTQSEQWFLNATRNINMDDSKIITKIDDL